MKETSSASDPAGRGYSPMCEATGSTDKRAKAKERSRKYYSANKDRCRRLAYERACRNGRIKQPREATLARYGLSLGEGGVRL